MLKRLRIKFICINMAIVLVMLTAILVAVMEFTRRSLEATAVTFMQQIAADPQQRIVPGEGVAGALLPYFSVELTSAGLLSVTNGGFYDLEDAGTLRDITAQAAEAERCSGILAAYRLRYYRCSTPEGQRIVFSDMSNEHSIMKNMLRICLLIGGAGVIVFFLISLGLSRWAIRPVDTAWKRQKRFVADASHELKTPLAVVILNAELLEASVADHVLRARLQTILTGANQMRSLVYSLLELARTDHGLPGQQMCRVDLSTAVSLGALSAEALFLEKNQTLQVQVEPDIAVWGSRCDLERLLTVFLENAGRYGNRNGTVRVSLKKCGRRFCLLSVCNTGDPIPQEKLAQIFDRFVRLDEARACAGGYGLGLSIAEGIVRAHRGKIWAESSQAQNTFFVRLPVCRRRGFTSCLQV